MTAPRKRTDVVLIESDEDVPPTKIAKSSNGNRRREPLRKPYMTSDVDSSDEDVSNSQGEELQQSQNQTLQQDVSSSESPFGSSSSPEDSSSDSDNPNKSSLEPISVEEYKASVSEAAALAGEEHPQSIQDPTQVPPEVRLETRKYLKANGIMNFLDKYLPTTASADDILSLILRLGFLPKDIGEYEDEDNLIRLIQILNLAMKKTLSMRNRLSDFNTMDDLLAKIESSKKIMVITGAGISTSLGIPDFRSSKGFYSQLQHLGLSDPQEVFDLDFFHTDPTIFYSIAHMILPPENSYTPLHTFIKLLQDKGKLLRNYTQNIDNLEGTVGIEPERLIQCHGSFAYASCITCGYQVKGDVIFPEIRKKEIAYCPKCSPKRKKLLAKDDVYVQESFGVMKPDITFFGEPLPSRFHKMIKQDIVDCDLLICVGTSLKVAPVSHILDRVPEDIPQILINKDPIDHFNLDISLLGYCDEAASYLCNKLGWNLPHKDYDSIRGPNGSNLTLETLDAVNGVFQVNKKN
ncbi:NAD-dependent histone deacetylase Sir2p [[Candida] anglica]|uniref:NAD-dependent histone deacetylase Sir2p n=1 Tax=[Candida] anglica TaxID=148631 RepID=A0ABP0E925_9ASCO